MNPPNQITTLINRLTKDEDQRQDLWVHYLSGNSPDSFTSYLEKSKKKHLVEEELQNKLWFAFKNPPSDKFKELLGKLSDIEQSVACLLTLGLTVSQVSKYKGIAEIRVRQVISVMRENSCWEEFYAEEKINRRRASRSK